MRLRKTVLAGLALLGGGMMGLAGCGAAGGDPELAGGGTVIGGEDLPEENLLTKGPDYEKRLGVDRIEPEQTVPNGRVH